ncbi:tripartite tricarboxylate transporter substrate binding protein [Bradyrhizobium sp. LHD-71]|uniref:Bug family tripartite tricarboxylate transporter substrate binding protein n=1 Tax=Bradyrhizobium sp. LHD-71 TaxID=3072141 RepID=UPI00280F4B56|nr:tripartite tricarboxylate transporter substrate binding protein [Bradyrhizobium sp. LHD-71]MDQ8728023.1 tripartite tricarboxylate transporter substrate binding protein [Bradyrhizobium sp. LHD-71]
MTDTLARALGHAIQESFGQPVIVENKPGAQGTLAAAMVAQSKPDGHTLLVGSSVMFVAKSLYKALSYDPIGSFQPVSGIGSTSMLFMVADASPIRTIADLTKAVQGEPAPVTIGFGSPSAQVALALFSAVTRSNPVPVGYRGTPQALTDLAGGHVQVAIVDIGNGMSQMDATRMRPIVISAASRYSALPDVPTLQETFPDASGTLETIVAIMAPTGTPAAVVERLDTAIRAALARPEVQARFGLMHTSVMPLSPVQLARRIADDNPRWEALIRKAGIEPQ